MKIVNIVGARPQFIKAAVISRAIKKHNQLVPDNSERVHEVIVHTGQHYDRNMSYVFFEEMSIPRPDYFLNINGLSHGAMTGQMLEKIESVLIKEKPDVVLVYGDTNTTLAGALAAAKIHLTVAHVEAGLRSFNRKMPEEINRVVTDHIANFLFCPTKQSVENLKAEGIINKEYPSYNNNSSSMVQNAFVCFVGDVMLDAALYYKDYARKPNLELPEKFILATLHRAENTDNSNRLKSIFNAFEKISKELPIILPLHPRTRKNIERLNLKISNPNLKIIEPISYLEIIHLLEKSTIVATDSGGLQKEAYFFKKPCITLRNETEWVELVENGFNHLTGADPEIMYDGYKTFIEADLDFSIEFYGDGNAGERIIDLLKQSLAPRQVSEIAQTVKIAQ
jgi:UDP-GlcNAc3NAcA epimerase